jgi:hypothetical protein
MCGVAPRRRGGPAGAREAFRFLIRDGRTWLKSSRYKLVGAARPNYPSEWREECSEHGSTGVSPRNASRARWFLWRAAGQWRLPARLGSCIDALRRKRDSDDAQQCGQQR